MSIINQALRDLDARKAAPLPPQAPLSPVTRSFRSWRGFQVAGIVSLLLAGLITWLVRWPAEVTPPQHVVAIQPEATQQDAVAVMVVPPEPVAEVAPMPARAEQPAGEGVDPKPTKTLASNVPTTDVPAQNEIAGRLVSPMSLKLADIAAPPPEIRKKINQPSAEEEAEERYRKAVTLIQKGRENQARPLLEESISLFPGHVAARQMLATLLSETGLSVEAEAVLRDGRIASPDNTWFVLNLARLQAARGEVEGAVASLQSGIAGRGVNAEYRATLAALLARLKQHAEAAHQYGLALKLQPEQGTWWMGLGLAMAAQGKSDEAHAAYRRSLTAGNLPEKLEEFVRTKLAE